MRRQFGCITGEYGPRLNRRKVGKFGEQEDVGQALGERERIKIHSAIGDRPCREGDGVAC
jgi:hypothetical protein